MVHIREYLLVFGGFFDNLREVKYMNDLHLFDLSLYKWTRVTPGPGAPVPSPRSGFQMTVRSHSHCLLQRSSAMACRQWLLACEHALVYMRSHAKGLARECARALTAAKVHSRLRAGRAYGGGRRRRPRPSLRRLLQEEGGNAAV